MQKGSNLYPSTSSPSRLPPTSSLAAVPIRRLARRRGSKGANWHGRPRPPPRRSDDGRREHRRRRWTSTSTPAVGDEARLLDFDPYSKKVGAAVRHHSASAEDLTCKASSVNCSCSGTPLSRSSEHLRTNLLLTASRTSDTLVRLSPDERLG